jgi:sulfatase modifying factor 1
MRVGAGLWIVGRRFTPTSIFPQHYSLLRIRRIRSFCIRGIRVISGPPRSVALMEHIEFVGWTGRVRFGRIGSMKASTVALPLWEIERHVIRVIHAQTGLDTRFIHVGSRLLEDLNIDSLDMVELILAVEEEFDVSIPDDITEKMFVQLPLTVGGLARIVAHQWGTGTPARTGWFANRPVRPPSLVRPFTQLGGVLDPEEYREKLHDPMAENDEGIRQYWRRTDGMRCLEIPAGEVEIGSREGQGAEDEHPLHTARLDAFLIDAEPVSVLAYARFLNSTVGVQSTYVSEWCGVAENDRRLKHFQLERKRGLWEPVEGTERQPMVLVSWHGAAAYSLWAHGLDWRGYRSGKCALPTEAQWEYAARGAQSRRYPWGDEPARPELASTEQHMARRLYLGKLPLAEVNERLGMSPFGGHHMAGTVWNWCADWYEPRFYERVEARAANPCAGRATGIRSERGGSWVGPASLARSSFRRGRPPAAVGRCLGFRCAVQMGATLP